MTDVGATSVSDVQSSHSASGRESRCDLERQTRRIRLLVLTRDLFPAFRPDVDILFGRELLGRGHEIDFVMQAGALDVGIGERRWRGRTVWVAPTDRGRSAFSRLRRLWLGFHHDIRCLFALAHRDRYDAVQVRNKFVVGVVALVVARWRGLKMFYWLSFPEPESRMDGADDGVARSRLANRVRGHLYGFLLYRWILPGCDHAFVQTQRMKQHIANMGIAPEKMTPVPMGVEPGELTRALGRRERDRADSQFVIAYLGTLNRQRRLEILIDTLALVRQAGVDARLVLVGDGERAKDRALLERRAALAGVAIT